jgi:hypothetical protein
MPDNVPNPLRKPGIFVPLLLLHMDRYSNPDTPSPDDAWSVLPDDYGELDDELEGGDEGAVERQLAHYAFVREERDREVRLHFRDVPSSEIARAFREAGAYLISLTAERAHLGGVGEMGGDAVVRYFYSLRETVYTVSIASSVGVFGSIAGVYPLAAPMEAEVVKRGHVAIMPDEVPAQ